MLRKVFAATLISCFASIAWASGDVSTQLSKLVEGPLADWTRDPAIIAAVQAQNTKTADFSEEEILRLDQTWRAETATGGALITEVLGNALSAHLGGLKEGGKGRFTEIFVTDARGLNVGQSDVTSDYWQGDEDKWQVPMATRAAHFGKIEFDESSQNYQSQISVPIMVDGTVIGVITVGVLVE